MCMRFWLPSLCCFAATIQEYISLSHSNKPSTGDGHAAAGPQAYSTSRALADGVNCHANQGLGGSKKCGRTYVPHVFSFPAEVCAT